MKARSALKKTASSLLKARSWTEKIAFALLLMLLLLFFSQGIKLSFWDQEINDEKSQVSPLFSGWRAQLQNITGIIVQMPNKSYVASYLKSLEWSKEINIQTYELTEKRVKNWIQSQAQSGVKFRIMLENKKYQQYQNTFKTLQNLRSGEKNIELKSDEHLPTTYLHSKITLADSGFWIQSSNLTHSTFANNREHLFRSENPQVLASLKSLFAKDFSGDTVNTAELHPNLVVCNINCRAVILDLLANAQRSITIQTQYLTDPELFELIAEKSQILDFKAIFSDTESNQKLPNYFGSHQVRLLKKPYVHTKMILVDDEILLLWSMNLSANSLDNNREIWILLLDPALIAQFKKEFAKDRSIAK